MVKMTNSRNLDKIDLKLLETVQKDARQTADQLGLACGLSPSAAMKRLNKLRSEGVIEREVAIVSPRAVGQTVFVIILVTLERESKTVIDDFKRALKECGEVIQGYSITGDADFVLMVSARSMEEYEVFTRDFFYERQNIKSFKSLVVLDRVKTGQALPFPDISS